MTTSARASSHVPALDGVRGVAILLVLAYNFSHFARESLPLDTLTQVTSLGMRGVDLFFVLSGYLITGILWDTRTSPGYFKSFYVRRALRILPLYYLIVFGVTVLGPLAAPHADRVQELAAQAGWLWTHTINVSVSIKQSWSFGPLNHFWSLSVEEQFYVFWPLVVWWLPRRPLLIVCRALAILALAARAWMILGAENGEAAYALTPCRMDALLLGAMLALEVRPPLAEPRGPSFTLRLGPAASILAPLLVLLEAVPAIADLLPGWIAPVLFPSLWSLVFTALVAAAREHGQLARALEAGWLQAMGRYSYGIYVYHHLLRSLLGRLVPLEALSTSLHSDLLAFLVFAAVALLVCVGIAVASYHLVEARFLALKRFFTAQRPMPAPQASPSPAPPCVPEDS